MTVDCQSVAVRIIEELFNERRYELVDELYSDELINHDVSLPNKPNSKQQIVQLLQLHATAFPDHRYEMQHVVCNGDSVAMRWIVSGTHTGPLGDVPPTGRPFAIEGMSFLKFHKGKVQEIWQQFDTDGMQRQLGLPPSAAAL